MVAVSTSQKRELRFCPKKRTTSKWSYDSVPQARILSILDLTFGMEVLGALWGQRFQVETPRASSARSSLRNQYTLPLRLGRACFGSLDLHMFQTVSALVLALLFRARRNCRSLRALLHARDEQTAYSSDSYHSCFPYRRDSSLWDLRNH
jgi:hypothetical protein